MKVSGVRVWLWLSCLFAGAAGFAGAAIGGPVVVVPINGTVDDGMAHLVARSVAQANESGARAIVLDVNSPGGLVELRL